MKLEFDSVDEIAPFIESLIPCQVNKGICAYKYTILDCGIACQIHTLKKYVKKSELQIKKEYYEQTKKDSPIKWAICDYVNALEKIIKKHNLED